MVRLAVLGLFISLISACSTRAVAPSDVPVSSSDLPSVSTDAPVNAVEESNIMNFSEGNHHPAIANLFAKAESEKENNNWSGAMIYLEQARQIQPRNPAILYRQAWVKVQQYQPEQAKQLLNRAKVYSSGNSSLLEKIQQLFSNIDSF